MPSHGASKDEGFGKDLGVMHEASVTGRKVGLDKDFFAALAHDEGLFYRTIAFVKNGGRDPYTPYYAARHIMGQENFIGPEEYQAIMKKEEDGLFLPDNEMVPFTRRMLKDVKDTHVLIKVGHRFRIRSYYQGEIQIDEGATRGVDIGSSGSWHLIRRVDGPDTTQPKGLMEDVPHIGVLLQAATVYALHNPGKQLFDEPIISATSYGKGYHQTRAVIAPVTGKKKGLKINLYREHSDELTSFRLGGEVWSMETQ